MKSPLQIIKGITISACLYAWYIPVAMFKQPQAITIQEEIDVPFIVQWSDVSVEEPTVESVPTNTIETIVSEKIEQKDTKHIKKTVNPTKMVEQEKKKDTAEPTKQPENADEPPQSIDSAISVNIKQTKVRQHTKKTKRHPQKCQIDNPNIEQIDPISFRMPKALFKHYATHWIEANSLARLVWKDNSNGEHYGIAIKHIACTSPLKFTGLQRGDVVLSVNEHTLQSDRDILKLYAKALLWKEIDVIILRKGKPMKLHYSIV